MMMTIVLTSADERGESSLVAEEGATKALLVISETILSIAYSVRKASPCTVSLQRLMSLYVYFSLLVHIFVESKRTYGLITEALQNYSGSIAHDHLFGHPRAAPSSRKLYLCHKLDNKRYTLTLFRQHLQRGVTV